MLSYLLSSEVSKCSILKTFSTFCLQSNKPLPEISIPALGVRLGLPNSPPLGKQRAVSALNVPPTQMSGLKKNQREKPAYTPGRQQTLEDGPWVTWATQMCTQRYVLPRRSHKQGSRPVTGAQREVQPWQEKGQRDSWEV